MMGTPLSLIFLLVNPEAVHNPTTLPALQFSAILSSAFGIAAAITVLGKRAIGVTLATLWLLSSLFTGLMADIALASNGFWGSIIYTAIWVPYFLTSKRVKNTLVNGSDSSVPMV